MADRNSGAAVNQRFFVRETSWSAGGLTVPGRTGAMGEGDSHPILQGASLFCCEEAGLEPSSEPRGEELGGLSRVCSHVVITRENDLSDSLETHLEVGGVGGVIEDLTETKWEVGGVTVTPDNQFLLLGEFGAQADFLDKIDQYDRLVGWYSLKNLLQPRHPFFEGQQAYLEDFAVYRRPGAEKFIIYPQVAGPHGGRMPLGNPYRLRKISRSNTARKIKALFRVADTHKVTLRLAHVQTPCPKPVSEWVIRKFKSRRQVMWKELAKPFLEGLEAILGCGIGADSNYHPWSSERPWEPHSHFHHLVANAGLVESPGDVDENDEPALTMVEIPWHRQRGGNRHEVPFSDEQRQAIQKLWFDLLVVFCDRHGVEWEPENGYQSVYVHIRPKDNKMAMMGSINYCNRHPLEDYAVAAVDNLAAPDPPAWLLGYANRSRPFGWWRSLKVWAGNRKEEMEKLHPVTGEKMDYLGKYSLREILSRGQLGYLDIVKGKPAHHVLYDEEIDWLRSVVRPPRPP